MKKLFVAVFILSMLCLFFICLWRIISTGRRGWKRRKEGGFWAAMNAVAKEDRERFLASQQAKAQAKSNAKPKGKRLEFRIGVTSSSDYDPETGEVHDDATYHESQNFADWEASLVQLWHGSIDIEFTYESRSGRTRRKVTLQKVMRNDRGSIYLRGYCHVREEIRTFSRDSIATMILVKGKRYEVEDFVTDFLGITTKELGWE
jgi:hypothetical protein